MFAEERRRRILDLVNGQGSVRLAELVTDLGVTEPTVRKDLSALEHQRLLKRTHGGAIAVRALFEPELAVREGRQVMAKRSIAAACAGLIDQGDSIYLDSGTTIHGICSRLAGLQVNVLTNSFGAGLALADLPGVRHNVLGGQYRTMSGSYVGPLAIRALHGFTVNTAFIGVTGLAKPGITVADVAEAEVKAAAIAIARRVVVAMDASKIGAADFALVATLDRIDCVVTDAANDVLEGLCGDNHIQLIVAPPL